MKPEEALNDLKLETFVIDDMIRYNKNFEPKNDCENLVRRKDALVTAMESLEKQIPYKPKEYEDKYFACKCGNVLMSKWEKYPTVLMPKSDGLPYCLNCGQKLDWD